MIMNSSNPKVHTESESTLSWMVTVGSMLGFALALIYSVPFIIKPAYDKAQAESAFEQRLKDASNGSDAGHFAAVKFIACRAELFPASRDACLSRVVTLAKIKGSSFEQEVLATIDRAKP